MRMITTLVLGLGLSLGLAACISVERSQPPARTTVVVPPNSSTTVVCPSGATSC
jgi:hypothetical protein